MTISHMLMVINGLMVKKRKKECLFLFFYVDPNLRFLIRDIYSLYVNIACICVMSVQHVS